MEHQRLGEAGNSADIVGGPLAAEAGEAAAWADHPMECWGKVALCPGHRQPGTAGESETL